MGVYFGFRAFSDNNSDIIDTIEDSSKSLIDEVFNIIPFYDESQDLETFRNNNRDFFEKMRRYNIEESDLEFIMYPDNYSYNKIRSTRFFDSKYCYDNFGKFVEYIKSLEDKTYYSLLLDVDTGQYLKDEQLNINGVYAGSYDINNKEKFLENIDKIDVVKWNTETRSLDLIKHFNGKIEYVTLYQYCKNDIDKFLEFFSKHGELNHLIQGYFS